MFITETTSPTENVNQIDDMFSLLSCAVASDRFSKMEPGQRENLIDSFKQVLFTSHCFPKVEQRETTLTVSAGGQA